MVEYKWRAQYFDGSVLEQFTDKGETLFSELELDKVHIFEVFTDADVVTKTFAIDLSNGQFHLNNVALNLAPHLNEEKHKLIYFRRRSEHITQLGTYSECRHVVGFECNIDGKVENHMYLIDEQGRGIVRLPKK